MDFGFFKSIKELKIGKYLSAEDFSDKYNFQFTPLVFILFLVITGFRQYVFKPIECWIPHQWEKQKAWEEYAENYCWVQDTYFAAIASGPQDSLARREEAKLSYYQWVPFVLGLQCLCFYIPHLVWKILSERMGTNVNQLVRFASKCATIDQEERTKQINYLAREVQKLMETKRDYRSKGCWHKCQTSVGRWLPCFWMGKRSGVFLIVVYLMVKVLYLLNAVAQLFLMKAFIGASSFTFGITLLVDLIHGKTWERNGMFPRVTWCDLPRRTVGQPITRSLMCVLPVNMLNEKIYIFLWFWILAGAVLILLSIVTWIVRMVFTKSRRAFVKKYLIIQDTVADDERERERELAKIDEFINQFLRHDDVFLLRMIAINAGELVAAELVAEVWKIWKEKRKETTGPEPLPNSRTPSNEAPPPQTPRRPLLPRVGNDRQQSDVV